MSKATLMVPVFAIVIASFYCCNVLATSLGEVATNLYEPIAMVIQLVRAVSIICGTGLTLGAILRYIDYRRNPVEVRLSVVFFMLLFGAGLIIAGLIPMQLGNNN